MTTRRLNSCVALGAVLLVAQAFGQDRLSRGSQAELHLRIESAQGGVHRSIPAVVWLEPTDGTPPLMSSAEGHYTLLQKNRTFIPHLQVVPVGSVVRFPNADPFFHNVFSLFDGKRFDLGLYEAGSSKSVTFSREGVSYIFCNIHPEMSAVIISLATPFYAIADTSNTLWIRGIPPGDYKMRLWIEGVPQHVLQELSRPVHLPAGTTDLGDLKVPVVRNTAHTNMYGGAYDQERKPPYDLP
jgi:hypothetical protein